MTPKLLICGMEHTGTTLISDLFRQIPGVDSGFECGVLLRASPSEFRALEPFASNMLAGWGITVDELNHCCAAPDFVQFYQRLMEASTAISDDTMAIFDKTPRYLSELSTVLERCDCPVIVSHKDPRAIVCSDFKRAKTGDFHEWYAGYRERKLAYVKACYDQFSKHIDCSRVAAVSLEDLAMNSRASMERIFEHAGEQFDLGYAIIDNLRYNNVKSRTVSPEIAFEFRRLLGKAEQEAIMQDFDCFDAWIYC